MDSSGVAAGLTILGGALELVGVWYVAEELTGKGPPAVGRWLRQRARAADRWLDRPMRWVGIHRRRDVTVHMGAASLSAAFGNVRVKIRRSADRSIDQKVADLQEDFDRLDDRMATQEETARAVRAELDGFPAKLLSDMERVADERYATAQQEVFRVRYTGFWFLLLGILATMAGILTGVSSA